MGSMTINSIELRVRAGDRMRPSEHERNVRLAAWIERRNHHPGSSAPITTDDGA
ncbi:hypothetical protein RESH_03050 [Rhodopirellula europaea SH398]|uniref:Uncharacterized protein n=1 Tax=Rhodopirellula europaea SH398 TaxID=1263868 RepID=M5SFE5_9BACT|nr:hypothetical protein RESH_03050 [Rhodopirellula europaea SH398]